MRNLRHERGVRALENEHSKMLNRIRAQKPELVEQLATVKCDWFRIRNAAGEEDEADLYIYDEIMPQWIAEFLGGVSAEGLITQLNEISASTINVRINSPGGALFEAIAIYNALMSHSATINVFVDSLAASAASVIAMAGDKITMMVGSQMMIHDAMGIEMGNAAELREFADFLDRQSENIASIYAEKSGGDPKELRDLMLAETWMFAEEAVELGLADEVYTRTANQESEEDDEDSEEETDPESEDPEEEDPEEKEPSKEDKPDEEEEDPNAEEDDDDEDEELENLMHRRHAIAAKGFKYAGRRKAPAPSIETTAHADNQRLMAFFGGK